MTRQATRVRRHFRTDYALRNPSHTYGEGRMCEYEGCSVPLSKYNPESYCSVHWQKLVLAEDERCMEEAEMVVEITSKKCAVCGETLPAIERFFNRSSKAKDGFRSECKLCRSARDKKRKHERKGDHVVLATYPSGRTVSYWVDD